MCGIVGANAKRDILDILLMGLHSLEYRGYDSAGLSIFHQGRINTVKAQGKVKSLEDEIEKTHFDKEGHMGIAHTRWATHGVPSAVNAHPHRAGTLSLVHNGIIENFKELKERLLKECETFVSETDTEVLAKLIYSYKKPGTNAFEATLKALREAGGSYAIALMDEEDCDYLVCARCHSPLVIGLGIGENFIASDLRALLPVTSSFIFLDDDEVAKVYQDKVEVYNLKGDRVNKQPSLITIDADTVSKGSYRHFMQKEIHEQPEALLNTYLTRLGADNVEDDAILGFTPGDFKDIKCVQIAACGTSYHAAMVGKYYLEELAGIHTGVDIASEYRYRKTVVLPQTLFICISQSGETADTLAALKLAKSQGYVKTLSICNVATSSLVHESDLVMLTRAGSEVSVASTKAFTTQLLSLLMLTIKMGRENGALEAPQGAKLIESIKKLPALTDEALRHENEIEKIAGDFAGKEHTLFLGRGAMYPIALEGALKLKELSYIHAEGYASGELKHGPIALIDANMPVVVVAPDNALLSKLISNVEEVKARGGKIYILASCGVELKESPDTKIITINCREDLLDPIVFTILLQLLAYHVAVINGTDVDQPRNLAKSVTVE